MKENWRFFLRIASGPFVFLAVFLISLEGLSYNGQVALGTFAWAVVWWIARPVPWGITSLLLLVIFPVFGVMSVRSATSLYGQRIFFWLLGITMLGYALEKHGLAKRVALLFLKIRGVANSTRVLTFVYMLVVALISMFISDAGVVAMMMPIGMSLFAYISRVGGITQEGGQKSPLASFLALGTLYAAIAGGVATIAGIPHNAVGVALADSLAGEHISWFRWMKVGFPLSMAMLVAFYSLLRYFFPPEIASIPGGRQFIEGELRKLGKMTRAEVNVLLSFLFMVLLFTLPPLISLALGAEDPFATRLRGALSIWVVPPATLFVLFLLPVDSARGEGTLSWRDVVERAPWNIIFLCTGAVGMSEALTKFGVLELLKDFVGSLGIGGGALPFVAAGSIVVGTNLFSGVAAATLFCNIFIPSAVELGLNPVSIAILIPNLAVGFIFPWAGANAGTAFASGYLDMKEMIKVGMVATLVILLIAVGIHLLMAPVL